MTAQLAISASRGGYGCALRLATREGITSAGGDDLATVVAELFGHQGLDAAQLSELRLDLGPGSYTGLRVAVTFAATLQQFARTAVRCATSLELLALFAWRTGAADPSAPVWAVIDARRGMVHHAVACPAAAGDTVVLREPPRATPLAQIASECGAETLVGDLATVDLMTAHGGVKCRAVAIAPRAEQLAELLFDPGLALATPPNHGLAPLYLMGSYAET